MAIQISQLNLDCLECDDILKKERGCKEKGQVPHTIDGIIYWRCPITLVAPETWQYLRAYGMFKKGILPNGIGWGQESEKFLQAISIIGNAISDIEKQELEKFKRRSHGNRNRKT